MALFNALLPSLSPRLHPTPPRPTCTYYAKKEDLALKGDIALPNKGLKIHPTGCSILDKRSSRTFHPNSSGSPYIPLIFFFFHVYLFHHPSILHVWMWLKYCTYIYIYMVSTILYENRVATSLNEWTRSSENSHRITSGIQLTESRIG